MPAPNQKKSDVTRRRLLDKALALFQKKGVEATTMRDIAKAAKLSLGAAYYYFPSKEALVFAYYEDNQQALEAVAAGATGTLRERLGTVFHGKLETVRPQKKMLAAIVQRLVDPSDPVGAFSAQTRAVRDRAMAVLDAILADANLPAAARSLAVRALWLLQMSLMLVYVNDDSPDERKTHGLVDDALDMLVPMLPMLATPMGMAIAERVTQALAKAGIGG